MAARTGGSESALGPDQKQAHNPKKGKAHPEAENQEIKGAGKVLLGFFQLHP